MLPNSLSVMPRITLKTTAQISEEIEHLNRTICKLNLIDQYRALHATIRQDIFLSNMQEIHIKTVHMAIMQASTISEISTIQTLTKYRK